SILRKLSARQPPVPPSSRACATSCNMGTRNSSAMPVTWRFLATPRAGHFEIDPVRVAEDARFDGIYVLGTNSTLPMLATAITYRQLCDFSDGKINIGNQPNLSIGRRHRRTSVLLVPRAAPSQGTR